jgi:hypothetical protein
MESTHHTSVRGLTLAIALAALPLVRGMTLHEAPGVSFGIFRLTTLHFFDLFVIVAVAAALVERERLRWPRSSIGWFAASIPLALAISLALTPSPRGLSMVLRWLAAAVLFASMTGFSKQQLRRHVAIPMLAMAAAQGVLAWLQLVTRSDAGMAWIGGAAPRVVNGVARAAGTFAVPYLLGAYALVAVGVGVALRPRPTPRWWLALVGGATLPVALTFSRAALIGLVAGWLLLALAARTDRSLRPVGAAILVGFFVPAVFNASGWAARLDDTDAAALSPQSDVRYELVEQAVELVADDWLVGVGAGRYSLALEERFAVDERTAHPVHLAPLLFVVEVGLLVGLVVAGLGARAVVDLFRRGPDTRVLLVFPLGFVLFDHLNVTHPIGPLLTMVWVGVMAWLVEEPVAVSRAPSMRR